MLAMFSGSVSRTIVGARTSLTLVFVLTFSIITSFSILALAMWVTLTVPWLGEAMYRYPSSSIHSILEALELTSMVTAIGSTGSSIAVTPASTEATRVTVATPSPPTLISTLWIGPWQEHSELLQYGSNASNTMIGISARRITSYHLFTEL